MRPFKSKRSQAIIKVLEKRYQHEDPDLRDLTNFILSVAPEEFTDVKEVTFKIMFSLRAIAQHSGQCRKLEDSVRYELKTDFLIQIWKEEFEERSKADKAKLIIHELHHIKVEDGKPIIRKHNEAENFCELPTHDLYAERVFQKIRDKLLLHEKALPS